MTTRDTRVPGGGVAVIGSLSKSAKSRLAKAVSGTFKQVSTEPSTHVLESKATDLRSLSERVHEAVGNEGVVAPLLVDEDGNQLFPTGTVQVRFKEPPSDSFLDKFARSNKVELKQRNKWAPAQVEFAVRTDDPRYLPDVVQTLQDNLHVMRAWLDTRAAYKRE